MFGFLGLGSDDCVKPVNAPAASMADATPSGAAESNPLWPRVAALSPQIRQHIKITPQTYRGERWYILHDETTGRHLRINVNAYSLIGRLDGSRTIAKIHDYLCSTNASGLSKKEIVDVIAQLQNLGALRGAIDNDTLSLIDQHRRRQSQARLRKFMSPLMIRIPLYDPDLLLQRMSSRVGVLFSPMLLAIWCLVIVAGVASIFGDWSVITLEFDSQVFKPANLVLLWVLYPILKTVHEFAHALCVKFWGGEVHEMGITLLVLTPIPYVDASAASSFRSKRVRILVSAAGIMVELFLAAVAIIFWVHSEAGFLADCAFGVFTIGSISTVLFNANPLLKFDGYFIFQDWLEIPNLYARSAAYYKYLIRKYWLKVPGAISPQTADGERFWFIVYGASSQIYRLVVMFFIVVFLSGKYMLLGVALGGWAIFQQLVLPSYRGFKYLLESPELSDNRRSKLTSLFTVALLISMLLIFVPVPKATYAEGVLWMPDQGQLYASSNGFVEKIVAEPGASVRTGDALIVLSNPELARERDVLQAEVAALEIVSADSRQNDLVEMSIARRDLLLKQAELAEVTERLGNQVVRAGVNGTFAVTAIASLVGRYFEQGELIGHVVDPLQLVVRVAIPEVDSGPLHQGIRTASIRLAENLSQIVPAMLDHETPSANNQLPSAALGARGGGGIAVASSDPEGLTSIEKVFHLQLKLKQGISAFGVGERAYVKLTHKAEPIAGRWYRSLQQLFLKKLPA